MTDAANETKFSKIKMRKDGQELEFSSMEDFERWAASQPDGKGMVEQIKMMARERNEEICSAELAKNFTFNDIARGKKYSFSSREEFEGWLANHPEYRDVNEHFLHEREMIKISENPKIGSLMKEISERLMMGSELSESEVRQLCSSRNLDEPEHNMVLSRLKSDSRFQNTRRSVLGFLGIGELFFSIRK